MYTRSVDGIDGVDGIRLQSRQCKSAIMDVRDVNVEVLDQVDEDNCDPGLDLEVVGVPAQPIVDDGEESDTDDDSASNAKCKKDSRRAWVVCFAAFLIQVLIVGVLHVFGVFFVAFIDEFNCSRSEAAWIGSLAYGLTMFLGPIVSSLINRFGNRIVAMLGCCICSISLLISSFMPNVLSLYASFGVLYGIGTCMAYTPTMTIAGDYFDKYLTVATGFMVAGSSTGTLILSPIAQAIQSALGWRHSFRILSAIVLIGVLSGYMFKPLRPLSSRKNSHIKGIKKSIAKPLMKELQLWKNKVFVVWCIGITFAMFGYYVPYVHMVSHALDLGISPENASVLLMLLGGTTAVGRIMFGKIVEYGFLHRLHMHQLSMVITGTACLMLPLITTFYGLILYVLLVGLVDGCFVVLMPVLTSSLFGSENKVTAWGLLIGISSITFTAGPPMAGWLYDVYGSYNIAFHVAGVPIIMGALILMFIPWAQRTAVTTNVMQAARSIYNTNLYQDNYADPGMTNEPVEEIPLNLYAITSEESNTRSDDPMLPPLGSVAEELTATTAATAAAGSAATKPYLVVDITEAVRQKVEEVMASYRNQSADVEAITDGPLSQLGTPAFRIGSMPGRGQRSHRGTPSDQGQGPITIKLAMSPCVVNNSSVPSSAPRVIRAGGVYKPASSSKHGSSFNPGTSMNPATSFKGRSSTPTSSVAGSGQSSIQDLRRRMIHYSNIGASGGPSPSSIPRVVVPSRPTDNAVAGSFPYGNRQNGGTQTNDKGIATCVTGVGASEDQDPLPTGSRTSKTNHPPSKAPVVSPLRDATSTDLQPFFAIDPQEKSVQAGSKSRDDSYVHVDLPNISTQQESPQHMDRTGSSNDITPTNTPRKLGETEPMFQMSDISLSETKEHQHPPPPQK